MDIDHIHFYVEDAQRWRDWFVQILGFQAIATGANSQTHTEVVRNGAVYFLLSSPCSEQSPVAQYLKRHPPGVADLAFRVSDLAAVLKQAIAAGAKLLLPLEGERQIRGGLKIAQIQGWGDLRHTLVERAGVTSLLPLTLEPNYWQVGLPIWSPYAELSLTAPDVIRESAVHFTGIDHVVLNVAEGDLTRAIAWYESILGFQRKQAFAIQTERSALNSQVLVHPDGNVQYPINEPASTHSQIQEFLDVNAGAGIQHIALQTAAIVPAIAQLRQQGLTFLPVPQTYYEQLQQRPGFQLSEAVWQAIAAQEVLVDWQPEVSPAMLLQAFTQPIFDQPTFFFELIERQVSWVGEQHHRAQGFGEGNFRALFEAIEREQIRRGSLR